MATHPIGKNKTLLSIPVHKEVARQLGRRAFALDVSKAEIARRFLEGYLAGEIALPEKREGKR